MAATLVAGSVAGSAPGVKSVSNSIQLVSGQVR